MFRHIVLFRVHDDVPERQVESAIDDLRSLGRGPGIATFEVRRSTDERKGRMIVEDAAFINRAAFEVLRSSPEHAEVARRLSSISDWWIGDYELS